jgi:hypothetical protein
MKISKARLRQIISESYKKILLKENPAIVLGGVTLVISTELILQAVLITIIGICICHLYKLHRTAFKAPEVFRANDILSNAKIVSLLAGARQWAIDNKDEGLLKEIDKAKRLSSELMSDLDLKLFNFDTASLSSIDLGASIIQVTRQIGKLTSTTGLGIIGVLTAGYDIATFENKLNKLDEGKVRRCMNTIQGVVNIAQQIDTGTIGKGQPSRHAKIKIDGDGLRIDTSSRNERLPGEGAPPSGRPDVGPEY